MSDFSHPDNPYNPKSRIERDAKRAASKSSPEHLERIARQNAARAAAKVANDLAGGAVSSSSTYRPIENLAAKERARAANHERRAMLKAVGGEFTPEQWQEVLAECGNRCLRCHATDNLTVDHVKPIHLGGSNDVSNLQVLCRSCNSWKRARHIDFRPGRET